jgi:hypothetical protein
MNANGAGTPPTDGEYPLNRRALLRRAGTMGSPRAPVSPLAPLIATALPPQ